MKFWIDFSGYVCVDAESKQDAEQKMWDAINRTLAFPTCFYDDVWDIDSIEPAENTNPMNLYTRW